MKEPKKISLFYLLAGILFAILVLRQSFYFIRFLIDAIEYGYDSIFSTVVWYLLFVGVYALTTICLLIGAFLNRRSGLAKALPVIGLGALALAVLFSFIRGFWDHSYTVYSYITYRASFNLLCVLPSLMDLTGCAVLFILAAAMPPALAKNPKSKLRMLCILPALLVFTSDVMTYVIGFVLQHLFELIWYAGTFNFLNVYYLIRLFFNAVYVAAILFAGLGCASLSVPAEKQEVSYNGPSPDPAYVPNPAFDPGTAPLSDPVYGPGPAQVVDPSYLPDPTYIPGPVPGPDPTYVPGPMPGPDPAYVPNPAFDPGTAPLPGPDSIYVPGPPYVPGPAPVPGPTYFPGPAPVPGPVYVPDSTPVPGPAQYNPPQVNVVEELKQYKALLDTGVITQEEFDAKKKQLLNL